MRGSPAVAAALNGYSPQDGATTTNAGAQCFRLVNKNNASNPL